MTPLLELTDVTRVFRVGDIETTAVNRVNFALHPGEFSVIQGPSGGGKSTLLSLMGLLDRPSDGSIRVKGEETSDINDLGLARLRNRSLGFVFQSFQLSSQLSLLDNVALPLALRGDVDRGTRRQRAAHWLERVGLGHRMHHFPAEVSGGQQQRVAVARALVGSPEIILADEPTGNLDQHTASMLMELILQLKDANTGIVLVTHEERFADIGTAHWSMVDGALSRRHAVRQ
jgi:putative ABC transport system ATP-binding protein